MKKVITIFGSSLPVEGDAEYENAYKLGALLAEKGFDICNGGNCGIMEATAKGALEKGAKATGITIKHFSSRTNKYLTELVVCETLFERITKLISCADGFVILKGGTGTLLELAAAWELMNKNIMGVKPITCHSSLWKDIVTVMEKQIESEKRETGLVSCFDRVEDIAEYLALKLS
jgi:uncharacterized protein (TIGR00730 family)